MGTREIVIDTHALAPCWVTPCLVWLVDSIIVIACHVEYRHLAYGYAMLGAVDAIETGEALSPLR